MLLTETILDYLNEYEFESNNDSIETYGWDFMDNIGDKGLEFHTGATRGCYTCPDWNYVIKFDLYKNGTYCQTELRNYERAKFYRVEQVLLPIERHTILDNGIEIYFQTPYTSSYKNCPKDVARELEKAKGAMNPKLFNHICASMNYDIADRWVARVVQLYGKKFLKSFQEWRKECEVNDLHKGNIGFLGNRPIILDYAGYHG
jgi:hypothetical protein